MPLHSKFAVSLRAADRKALAAAMLLALATTPALSEEPAKVTPPGLPPGVDWTFNFDGSWGAFGFANSLYRNPKPDQPSGNLSDNWFEGSIKPALGGVYTFGNSSQLYGKLSAVGERTYSGSPTLVGGDASSFNAEDLYVGWRSGNTVALGENALDFTFGRTQYKIGHGLILWDGSAEGGSRGGYWTNARKSWKVAAIGRLKAGGSTFEAFYLEKGELPESDKHNNLAGLNYEYRIGEDTTLGATYIEWNADKNLAPQRDGLDVLNVRAYTAPFPSLKGLSFEFEYVRESNGNALDSSAWNGLVAYKFNSPWQPKISYRYAFFQGDDPTTPTRNEAFDGLSTGFSDWGAWWQGEIAGEYFLSNSNLISHQLRLHLTPNETIGTGLIFYDFRIDQPKSLGPQVTSESAAYEFDWYMDWSVTKNFVLSFVAATAQPNKAVEQLTGRTDAFYYGMVYAAYSF